MQIFKLKTLEHYKVNAAVTFCNDVLLNSDGLLQEFLQAIDEKEFDMATCSGDYIARKILAFRESGSVINIKYYKSLFPCSKARGYYTHKRPFDINVNLRRIDRPTASFVETLVHEFIHILDGLDWANDFGHGDNSKEGKEKTAPYAIAAIARDLYLGRLS